MQNYIKIRNQEKQVAYAINIKTKEVECRDCFNPFTEACCCQICDNLIATINENVVLIQKLSDTELIHDEIDNESIYDDNDSDYDQFTYDEEELPFKYDTDSDSDSDVYDEIDYPPKIITTDDIFNSFILRINLSGIKLCQSFENEIYYSIAKLNQDEIKNQLDKMEDKICFKVKLFSDALYFLLRECNECKQHKNKISGTRTLHLISDVVGNISITREFMNYDFSYKLDKLLHLKNKIFYDTFRHIVDLYPNYFKNNIFNKNYKLSRYFMNY
jgi:hypothetical protein